MNKRRRVVGVQNLKPCSRRDFHLNTPPSWPPQLSCSPRRTVTKTRHGRPLLCVVVQYKLQEQQIKSSSNVRVSVSFHPYSMKTPLQVCARV